MLILALVAALPAPAAGNTMAADDWHHMKVLSVGRDVSEGPPYYVRVQAGDLDGDGLADKADLKLDCTHVILTDASYTVPSPRDLASGQSTGRRSHEVVGFVTEWASASPELTTIEPSYDVKKMERARSGRTKWASITLRNADGLCASTAAAAAAIVKSKSNIQITDKQRDLPDVSSGHPVCALQLFAALPLADRIAQRANASDGAPGDSLALET